MSWQPHLALAHDLWARHLRKGESALDATCGNGHDTLFLTTLGLGQIVSIDLQPQALAKAKERLKGRDTGVLFLLASHQNLALLPLPTPLALIVYNLGYLPGGDKTVTTRTETTLQSVQSALPLLSPRGALSITCYPGHDEGKREEEGLLAWASSLPSEEWEVCFSQWINRAKAPSLLWIAKRVKGRPIDPRSAERDVGL